MQPMRRSNLGRRTRRAPSQANYQSNRTREKCRAQREIERFRMSQTRGEPRVAFNTHRAVFHYNVAIDYSVHKSVMFESINVMCLHCKALKYKNEVLGLCCASSKVKLMSLISPPEPFIRWFPEQERFQYFFFLTNI